MLVEKAKRYALDEHRFINQTYDGRDYGFHLEIAHAVYQHFAHLLDQFDYVSEIATECSVFLHDVLEDSWRVSYNKLKQDFGHKVAEVVYLVSEERGRTRSSRHNHKYLTGVASMTEATFVKLCDNIANVLISCHTESSKFDMYRSEHSNFYDYLYIDEFCDMFNLLDTIYATKKVSVEWVSVIEALEAKYPKLS